MFMVVEHPTFNFFKNQLKISRKTDQRPRCGGGVVVLKPTLVRVLTSTSAGDGV